MPVAADTVTPMDAGDKGGRLRSDRTDADFFALATTAAKVADIDVVIARGEINAGVIAQCDVAAAVVLLMSVAAPMAVLKPPVVLLKSAA
jgi:hypothetical protein